MDYDHLFPNNAPETPCECTSQVRVTILLMTAIYLMLDYTCSPRNQKEKISELTAENASLKSIILKSVNRSFDRMMKNGNDSEDDN